MKADAQLLIARKDKVYLDGSQPTSYDLVKEINDKIDYNKSDKVLVLFDYVFAVDLVDRGIKDVTVAATTLNPKMNAWLDELGIKTTTIEEAKDMKFDVVVGNPPYQNNHNAKRWVLWHEFAMFAKSVSDKVALVVPSSFVSPSNVFQEYKKGLRIINLSKKMKKLFKNVGSSFCYFVYDKNHKGDTLLVSHDCETMIDLSNQKFLPTEPTKENLELLSKLKGTRVWKRGEFHTSNKEWMSTTGTTVYHTNSQQFKTEKFHPNKEKIRVSITLSGYPKAIVLCNEYVSQVNFWTEFETLEEAKEFADYCNSEEIQKALTTFKWSGWNSKEVIEMI